MLIGKEVRPRKMFIDKEGRRGPDISEMEQFQVIMSLKK